MVLVCPTAWDAAQLRRLGRDHTFPLPIQLYGPDAEHDPHRFDAETFIREAIEHLGTSGIAGVASSSDYPGSLIAAVIAQELGLPGPNPRSMLQCSHKYYSRLAQSQAVPEATPAFALLDPLSLYEQAVPLSFPFFVKPVKSWFSQLARRVDSYEELSRFITSPDVAFHLTEFVRPFNQLLTREGFDLSASYMLAEELLTGHQVTLEGFIFEGRLTVVGIVDSQMYRNTRSFERFDYPSRIGAALADRMASLAERFLAYIGLENTLFNVEFIYDFRADTIHIIEVNPRMCSQFADLMESVNARNTYEIMFALARGERPPPAGNGHHKAATSFVLRHFHDASVEHAPSPGDLAAVQSFPEVTLMATFYENGERLSDENYQFDGFSYRYAVVNMAGPDRAHLTRRFRAVRERLNFRFRNVVPP